MSLFKGIKKDPTNADLGWISDKSSAYISGYKLAAEKLSEGYEHLDTQAKDSLIFPIIFLYRQHIELSLKSIIRELEIKLNNNREPEELEHHKLLNLWDESEKLYNQFLQDNSVSLVFTKPEATKERSIVNDFNMVDKNSFSFRYSTNKDNTKSLGGIDYISLNNFQTQISIVIERIENIIETLSHSVADQTLFAYEMRTPYC
jgi:hypothetical protein